MTRSFDRIADTYDATRGGEERGRRYAEDIHPLFATDGLALEVGIGTGLVAKGLVELGRAVVGIDIGPQMLRHAFARIGPRVAVGDALEMPVRSVSVDNAYSVWVLHVVDPARVMKEAVRVLRPGGRYIVTSSVPPEPDPITDIVRVMYERLTGNGPRSDGVAIVTDAASDVGLHLAVEGVVSRQTFWESPEDNARSFEARSPSVLWDVDETQWEEAVAPTIRALRALPDPERAIERTSITPILVFER